MAGFAALTSASVVLRQTNIDTDQIIPARFLSTTERAGLGRNAFNDWRWQADGTPNPEFAFNQPQNAGRQILLAGRNFGCGSSREHAPWALDDYGFRAVIAPSFADIFFNNCYKNGLLPIVLTEEQVDQLFKEVEANEGYQLSIDLAEQTLTTPSGETFKFDITEHRKHCLLNGLDEIGLTLQHADEIRDFEEKRRQSQPWLFNG